MTTITDTPTGAICVTPWAGVEKTLLCDLTVYLAGRRQTRNIYNARKGFVAETNMHQEIGLVLDKVPSGQAPIEYEYTGVPGTRFTLMDSNTPIRVILTDTEGTHDLGIVSVFLVDKACTKLKLINELNAEKAQINLITI